MSKLLNGIECFFRGFYITDGGDISNSPPYNEHLAQLVERKPCYNMEEGINKKKFIKDKT